MMLAESSSQNFLTPHIRSLDDVLRMRKTMSSAVSRVDERIERVDASMNEIKAEQSVIKENLRNMERSLETLLNALRAQMTAPPSQASGSQVMLDVGPSEQPPEDPNPDPVMEIERSDTSGPAIIIKLEDDAPEVTVSAESMGTSDRMHVDKRPGQPSTSLPMQTTLEEQPTEHSNPDPAMEIVSERTDIRNKGKKRKFEEDTPEIPDASIDMSSGTQKLPSHSSPTQAEAAERMDDDNDSEEEEAVRNITEMNTGRREDDEDDESERDELEDDTILADADADVEERMIRRKSKASRFRATGLTPALVFTNNKRCTACIHRGSMECIVLKTPYHKLEAYVDQVLARTTQKGRPKDSPCLACSEKHAKFCHLPITREKLGPGFTKAHLGGPFPVPASAPGKSREGSSPLLRPRILAPENLKREEGSSRVLLPHISAPENVEREEGSSRVLRPRKKPRTLSPEFPLSSNPVA